MEKYLKETPHFELVMPAQKKPQKTQNFFEALLFPEDAKEPTPWYIVPQSYVIDTMKGLCPIVIPAIMYLYREAPYNALENPAAWVYFGVHGSYGILWPMKNLMGFGDERFHSKKNLFIQITTFIALLGYWLPIYLICTSTKPTPPWVLGLGVFMYANGVFWHFASDMQKTQFLHMRAKAKKELGENQKIIDNVLMTKLWSVSRNPNYFGELLIYMSFAVLSYHWLPFVTFGTVIVSYWIPSMFKKDESLSRFGKTFEEYKQRTAMWIPYVW